MVAEGAEGSKPNQPAGVGWGEKASQMRLGRWDQSVAALKARAGESWFQGPVWASVRGIEPWEH